MDSKIPKPIHPLHVFITAEAFDWACEVVTDNRASASDKVVWQIVVGTNAAFALELYLKSLLLIEQGTYPETHDLLELFRHLSRPTKGSLTKYHRAFIKGNKQFENYRKKGGKVDLLSLLEAGRNTFALYRYAHEKGPMGTYGLGGLMSGVRKRIIEKYPEWHKRQKA